MKLYYDRRSKNPTYFIQQGIRNGKKTTTRNIKKIGRHNDLLRITDDPLEYAKQEVAKYNEEYKAGKVSLDVNIDFLSFSKSRPITANFAGRPNVCANIFKYSLGISFCPSSNILQSSDK